MKLRNILFLMCLSVSLVCCPANMDEHKPNIDTSDARVGFFYAMLNTNEGSAKIRYSSKYDIAPATKVFTKHKVLDATDLPTLSQTGYTFNGWFDRNKQAIPGQYIVDMDTTLVAKWTVNKFKIIYHSNKSVDETFSQDMEYDKQYKLIKNSFTPETHYKFAGWSTYKDGPISFIDEEIVSNISSTDGYEYHLYAKWIDIAALPIVYHGYDSITDTIVSGTLPETYHSTDTVSNLAVIQRNGNTFCGWFKDISCLDGPITGWASGTFSGTVHLYAKWERYYRVYFDKNAYDATGDMAPMDIHNIISGEHLVANTFSRDKHLFDGWNTQPDGTGVAYADQAMIIPSEDITLYAQWHAYRYITFDANGGTRTMDTQAVLDSVSTSLTVKAFTKYDCEFDSWNTLPDGSGTTYVNGESVSLETDITLYAQWTPYCYVTFDANGGTGSMTTKRILRGRTLSLPSNAFKKAHYTFTKWRVDSSSTYYNNTQTITVNSDITLYAQWKVDVYTIKFQVVESDYTYKVGGSTITNFTKYNGVWCADDITVEYGKSFKVPACKTTCNLYDFDCYWDYRNLSHEAGETITVNDAFINNSLGGSKSFSFKAIFKPKTFTITYKDPDTSYTEKVTYKFKGTIPRLKYGSDFKAKTVTHQSCDPQTCAITNKSIEYTAYKWTVKESSLGYKKGETLDAGVVFGSAPTTYPYGDITLEAKYRPSKPLILLYANKPANYSDDDGSYDKCYVQQISYAYGDTSSVKLTKVDWTCTGYIPLGWSTSPDGCVEYTREGGIYPRNLFNYGDVTGPVSLYYVWQKQTWSTKIKTCITSGVTCEFKLWDHEVTQYEYYQVTGESKPSDSYKNRPKTNIGIRKILQYCNLLTELCNGARVKCPSGVIYVFSADDCYKYNGSTGDLNSLKSLYSSDISKLSVTVGTWDTDGIRLPTWREWRYAAQMYSFNTGANGSNGGSSDTNWPYYSGGYSNPATVAWYSGNSNNTLHDVKTRKANPVTGCYDMCGNVAEVVMEDYENIYDSETVPNEKILTSWGGYYKSTADEVRVNKWIKDFGDGINGKAYIGFRPATRNTLIVDKLD